jgi:large subunit ribosomal protein L15
MDLTTVRTAPLSRRKRARVGLGKSAGQGKTAGKGLRGQTVRSGHSLIRYFEGGQMPLTRKLPKRGFNNRRFALRFVHVNLEQLEKSFAEGEEVSPETLLSKRVVSRTLDGIRILGQGNLTKKLVVKARGFSRSAEQKIVKAGGQAVRVVRPGPGSLFGYVRLADLERKFNKGETIDAARLVKAGLLKDGSRPLKVVGQGTLTKKLTVKANRFSRSAFDKIRAAGGQAVVIPRETAR